MQESSTPETESTGPIHRGWHSRGYIPHFDHPGMVQGITFRLADSLPTHIHATIAKEIETADSPTKRIRMEAYLNAGYGSCHLRDPRIARIVEDALLHFDGVRYRLIAWVIMPNHVHVLIEVFEGYSLGRIVHSWKSYTANKANQILGRSGQFWFREYFDRYIRDERHLGNAVEYIHDNPVNAGLVKAPEDWPFSSARHHSQQDAGDPDYP
jgi:REP element-mobilizing transposase RayT